MNTASRLAVAGVPSRGVKTLKRQIRLRRPTKTKLKSRKSVVKRFFRTATGKLKYFPAGRNHNSSGKNQRRMKELRKAKFVKGGSMLKTLNKMMGHW